MMGKFALACLLTSFGFVGPSCASSPQAETAHSAVEVPVTEPTLVVNPIDAKDGGLVFIRIRLPKDFKGTHW
ncbi:MAG: hypothetical protein EOP09_04785, partial [Proteobacteria bacterium]